MSAAASKLKRLIFFGYLAALLLSFVVRAFSPTPEPRSGQRILTLAAVDGDRASGDAVRLAYTDSGQPADTTLPTVVVLHGSPASSTFMMPLHRALASRGSIRVITPDMPGFGRSTHDIPDYSTAAHARYLLQALDSLGVQHAHLVAYSMGGGIAIRAIEMAPGRVASVTMLSAIGVQELELTGDYHLNHLVHGFQLGMLWLIREAIPHFGWMDDALLGVEYARNFYDTDQRPFRHLLQAYRGPMNIIHGTDDFLVRYEVALEHRRIVPQSTLAPFQGGGHELVLSRADSLSALIGKFVADVESGVAPERSDAAPSRVAQAAVPFDPSQIPPANGFNLVVLFALIIAATLVSEDLACIGAGLLVARGTLTFLSGLSAAFAGIVLGDVMLYALGRAVGRRLIVRAPFRWIVGPDRLRRGAEWFRKKGFSVIVASRFVPGTRLPTYVAAGTLRAPFWKFLMYFLLASVVWTPALVGASVLLGEHVLRFYTLYEAYAVWVLVGLVIVLYTAVHVGIPALSHRGRRRLRSRWMRLTRWEFWPPVVFYAPLIPYLAWLGLRNRSFSLFTCANPAIPHGGVVGESKTEILQDLEKAGAPVATFLRLKNPSKTPDAVDDFLAATRETFPVVLKPDVGERGAGVCILRSRDQARRELAARTRPHILQSYIPGREFGVFYCRYPSEKEGFIFSITDKRMLSVAGDGRRTLEELILDDDRANCLAPLHCRVHADRLDWMPQDGIEVPLVEIGTHCRGSLFLDGGHLATDALREAFDRFCVSVPGFYFGRFDVRTPSAEALKSGRDFRIIELNGVTSEATGMYDPRHSLFFAWATLFRQWRIAYRIGSENRARGCRPSNLFTLARLVARHKLKSPGTN